MTATSAEPDAVPSAPQTDDPPVSGAARTGAADLPPARHRERLGLAALLLGTAAAYLWNITVNGMGNGFYAAATWSGARDWKALLFGSLDPGNFITVDKPPVSQWVMGLSGQLFGFSSASMLVPQALMAVATVALLYGAVTRVTGNRSAGLLAGFAFAVTPVVAMMFRFNNPDAVMVLLMTAGAYCTVRALPKASVRWLALAGVALGFAFLAKMLEGLMVLPALGLAYLVVAPTTLRHRLAHLLAAAVALVVSSGWYVLLTILWPASSRPYLAGSADNTFMDLVLGYNGFARFLGQNHQGGKRFQLPAGYEMPHMPNPGNAFGSAGAGPTKLFTGEIGFEISWLLPAALLAFALVVFARGRAPRTDLRRGAALVFGLWVLIDGIAFTVMKGGMHAYYTLAIAPAIAALLGLAAHELWVRRGDAFGRIGSAALILAGGLWGFVLLQRNSGWLPWLRWVIAAVAVAAALGLVVAALRRSTRNRMVGMLMAVGVLAALAGSTAYAAATLPRPHTGGSPSVGPARAPESGQASELRRQLNVFGGGAFDPRLLDLLRATNTRWSAAVDRSSNAAELELSTRTPVIAIGGFTSDDPVPTLDEFQRMVRDHEVSYYLVQELKLPDSWKTATNKNAPPGNSTPTASEPGTWRPVGHRDIADWVAAHYTPVLLGNYAVYDLTAPPH
ncbi:ArnT family glycosyltransferase [Nocardia panacis]|uniref:ArnT family glycosyltransferase n=1 Tax=Nocardia panacis TaxID=2340916 RepID=UPI001EEFA546|nr:glycosyltransferase family 39 protein [Nocardia panacis]